MIQEGGHVDLHYHLLKQHELPFDTCHRASSSGNQSPATAYEKNASEVSHCEVGHEIEKTWTYVIVLRSVVATSVFARLSTFWNSETRALILECMYALEHLIW